VVGVVVAVGATAGAVPAGAAFVAVAGAVVAVVAAAGGLAAGAVVVGVVVVGVVVVCPWIADFTAETTDSTVGTVTVGIVTAASRADGLLPVWPAALPARPLAPRSLAWVLLTP
jgi:hypothetical protein